MMSLAWQFVLHDNHRLMPVMRKVMGKPKACVIISSQYRAAKEASVLLLGAQWKQAPLDGPVALFAQVWFPDARRRDAGNYRKLITDALTGIAYADDSQLHRETWEFAGIDRSNPRITIEISPLTRSTTQCAPSAP